MPPPRQDLAGQVVLNDWYGQINNKLTINNVLDQLLPVQEMAKFQRRIRDREIKLSLTVGQKGVFTAIVPNGETWKLLWAGLRQTDSALKFTILTIRPRDPARVAMVISRVKVSNSLDVPLYPTSPVAVAGEQEVRSGPTYEAFAGDRVQIFDETSTAAAGPINWIPYIRYEILPAVVRHTTDAEFVASVQ